MAKGTEIHKEYSAPYQDWDRRLLRYQLAQEGPCFRKQVDDIEVRGSYDDLTITRDDVTGEKRVSFIELKTTSKGNMWCEELAVAIFQLQLYIWLMKDHLKSPWVLDKLHYVEVMRQQDRQTIKKICVREDFYIEDRIREIAMVFRGEKTMTRPRRLVCRICPRPVKEKCDWYKYEALQELGVMT